ncbi:MAG TPA: outer membrane beta-barrel protein [Armatimonadota bacterium]|jgi:outer membrane protein W
MKLTYVLAVAGLCASTAAFAQVGSRPQIYSDVTPPEAGTAEIGIALNAKLDKPSNQSMRVSFLPYLNRNVQVGGGLTYTHQSGYDVGAGESTVYVDSSTMYTVDLLANYNFVSASDAVTSRTVPYAGVGFSYIHAKSGDVSAHATGWGAQGGVKHFITNDVSVFGELNYRRYDKTIDENKDEWKFFVGLNTYLRK